MSSYSLEDVVTLSLPCGSLLGAGSSGSVQSVAPEAILDGLKYALKTVKLPSDSSVLPAELKSEIVLHASLPACDAILRYHFSWVHDGCLRILLERVHGMLWDVLEAEQDAAVSRSERLGWAHAILSAVALCHACGVAHRDVSPWNCFLSSGADGNAKEQRRLKLGDFGLACRVPRSGNSSGGAEAGVGDDDNGCGGARLFGLHSEGCAPLDESAIGSLYSAPELGSDDGYDPRQADIFSAGMTLFAIWHAVVESGSGKVGGTKVVSKDTDATIDEGLTDCVERLKAHSQLPAEWGGPMAELVLRMTRHQPDERPTAAECVELLKLATEPEVGTASAAPLPSTPPQAAEQVSVGGIGCFGYRRIKTTGARRTSKRVSPAVV